MGATTRNYTTASGLPGKRVRFIRVEGTRVRAQTIAARIRPNVCQPGQPWLSRAATAIAASANGSANTVWLNRTNSPHLRIVENIGVNPWVVHFFAFFLGVWGELTPPTSLVAAVTAKIANASFYSTLNRALQICISLFTLMAGVFVHPGLVIEPGINQLGAALLVLVATIGITFSLQAVFADRPAPDVSIRLILAAFALLLSPTSPAWCFNFGRGSLGMLLQKHIFRSNGAILLQLHLCLRWQRRGKRLFLLYVQGRNELMGIV